MKRAILFCLLLIMAFVIPVVGQYTGFEIEEMKPQELGPQPGPGDTMVITRLEETNRLLREQNQLMTEQNRLLRQLVDRKPKTNP